MVVYTLHFLQRVTRLTLKLTASQHVSEKSRDDPLSRVST